MSSCGARCRGQSMVELTLLLPVLLLVFAGIVDLGRVYRYDVAAINAARVGARVASDVRSSDIQVITAVQADTSPVAYTSITVTPSGARTPGATVTVTVRYTFKPITPLVESLLPGGQLSITRSASMVVL